MLTETAHIAAQHSHKNHGKPRPMKMLKTFPPRALLMAALPRPWRATSMDAARPAPKPFTSPSIPPARLISLYEARGLEGFFFVVVEPNKKKEKEKEKKGSFVLFSTQQ